jgi:hypothetical protein
MTGMVAWEPLSCPGANIEFKPPRDAWRRVEMTIASNALSDRVSNSRTGDRPR